MHRKEITGKIGSDRVTSVMLENFASIAILLKEAKKTQESKKRNLYSINVL